MSNFIVQTGDAKQKQSRSNEGKVVNLLNLELVSRGDRTKLTLEVARSLNIFANIFHINYMIDFSSRVFRDMKNKKDQIISRASDETIRACIRQGFQYLNQINEIAAAYSQQLAAEKSLTEKSAPFDFDIQMTAPKLVFDEFLMAA